MPTKTLKHKCAEPECKEWGYFEYDNRAEAIRIERDFARRPWRCVRHTFPESILSAERPLAQTSYIASRSDKYPDPKTLFWIGPHHTSGFTSGPGFKAWASDFPEGTKLTITAEIVMPAPESQKEES